MKYRKLACALAFLLASFIPQLQAQFYDWLGTTSDDWSDSSNWQDGATLGASDTARIYNSLTSSDPTPNNTVLKTGASVTLTRVWLGNSSDTNEFGVLTVESGASLTTSGDFNLENNSTLSSSGAILVNTGNGLLARDNSVVTLKNGSTLNKLNLEQNSTATLEDGSTLDTLRLTGDTQATMEAGSSVTTLQLANNSQLTMDSSYSSRIDVNSGSSLIMNGTVDESINFNTSGTGLIGENGIVTGSVNVNRTASVTVNGTVQGRIIANETGIAILNGTVLGDFKVGSSTEMQYINENGIVQGEVKLDGNDQLTIAGTVNGATEGFALSQSAHCTILPTANIISNNTSISWIFEDAQVTWKVGADGSVATLKTIRNAANYGDDPYGGQWRFTGVRTDSNTGITYTPVLKVDLTDCTVYGTPITLKLVSNIQNEDQFDSLMKFYYDGVELVDVFTWDGAGTGSFTGVLPNPAPDDDNDGVANVDDAFPNDPNETADSDGDDVGDNADAFPNDPNETVDTDGDNVGDNSDKHNGFDDTLINNALGIATAAGKINLSAWLATNSYIVDDGTSGGISQSDYDAALAAQATAETALASAREARPGSTVIDVANDLADITLRVEQTSDVSDWSSATTSDHTIQLSAPAGASFYRFTIPAE